MGWSWLFVMVVGPDLLVSRGLLSDPKASPLSSLYFFLCIWKAGISLDLWMKLIHKHLQKQMQWNCLFGLGQWLYMTIICPLLKFMFLLISSAIVSKNHATRKIRCHHYCLHIFWWTGLLCFFASSALARISIITAHTGQNPCMRSQAP